MIKTDNRKARRTGHTISVPPSKRHKKDPAQELLRRYPVSSPNLIEDPSSVQVHLKGIEEELKRSKPRESVLLPLFRSTFGERRLFVLNDAKSMKECYPAITIPALVSIMLTLKCQFLIIMHHNYCYCIHVVCINWIQFEHEFGLILGRSSAKRAFISEWCTKYVPAIISYGKRNSKRAI